MRYSYRRNRQTPFRERRHGPSRRRSSAPASTAFLTKRENPLPSGWGRRFEKVATKTSTSHPCPGRGSHDRRHADGEYGQSLRKINTWLLIPSMTEEPSNARKGSSETPVSAPIRLLAFAMDFVLLIFISMLIMLYLPKALGEQTANEFDNLTSRVAELFQQKQPDQRELDNVLRDLNFFRTKSTTTSS